MEWFEHDDVIAALDDLVLGSHPLIDNFLATLSAHEVLMSLDYSTLMIIGGIYTNAFTKFREKNINTALEAHKLAMAHVANHPISQSIAMHATATAIDNVGSE